jgi:hypothetical protein
VDDLVELFMTSAPPDIHVQINNSGAWKTVTVTGLNEMEACRKAVDTLCLVDKRSTNTRKATYRMAIANPSGFEPLEYRDPIRGWYQA